MPSRTPYLETRTRSSNPWAPLRQCPKAADLDLAQPVQAVADGLAQVRNDVLGSALGELAFAPGETRELRRSCWSRSPSSRTSSCPAYPMRDGVISAERVQETIDFVGDLALTADLPTEPDEIVDFLAQSFVGLPGSLLDAPWPSPVLCWTGWSRWPTPQRTTTCNFSSRA